MGINERGIETDEFVEEKTEQNISNEFNRKHNAISNKKLNI